MKFFLSLSLLLTLSSCVSIPPTDTNSANGYAITHTTNTKPIEGKVFIEYQDHEQATASFVQMLKNQYADQDLIDSAGDSIPAGGHIIVRIRRLTIDTANTQYFTYVFENNGSRVDLQRGKQDIPEVPTRGSNYWRNLDVVPVKDPITTPITFIVGDAFGNRDEFTISKQ